MNQVCFILHFTFSRAKYKNKKKPVAGVACRVVAIQRAVYIHQVVKNKRWLWIIVQLHINFFGNAD